MEIENSSEKDAHLELQDKIKMFSRQLDSLNKTIDEKFEIFREMNLVRNRKNFLKESEMEVESTGVSLTTKDSVGKFRSESGSNYLSEEDRLYDGEQTEFPAVLTPEQIKFFMDHLFNTDHKKNRNYPQSQANMMKNFKCPNLGKAERSTSKKYFKDKFDFEIGDGNENITLFQNLTIHENDLERLCPKVFLNDTLINFYIKLLQMYILNKEQKKDFYFFNTYFFSKLKSDLENEKKSNNAPIQISPTIQRELLQEKMNSIHKRLKKWHKRIKLLDKKHVFIPLNKKSEHWSLVVICNLNYLKKIITSEKNEHTVQKRPMILCFDSLMPSEPEICNILRMYLESEVRHCFKETYINEEGNFLVNETTLPHYQIIVPRQKNMTDCGVFILEYMERFCEDPNLLLEGIPEETIEKLKWFPSSIIKNKRDQMAEFLINLSTNSANVPGIDLIRDETKNLLGKRKDIFEQFQELDNEYDKFDYEEFEESLKKEFGDKEISADEKRAKQIDDFFLDVPPEIHEHIKEIQGGFEEP